VIVGIGVDIVEVERIRKAMSTPAFTQKILTEAERANGRHNDPLYVAGRWAAKEALHKAFSSVTRWHDVEVISNPAPTMTVRGLPPDHQVHVTISHERGHAVAMVILEKS